MLAIITTIMFKQSLIPKLLALGQFPGCPRLCLDLKSTPLSALLAVSAKSPRDFQRPSPGRLQVTCGQGGGEENCGWFIQLLPCDDKTE